MKPIARTLIVLGLVAAHGLAAAGPRYYGHHHNRHHHHHRGSGVAGAVVGLAIALPLLALASQQAERDRAPEVVYVPPPPPPQPVYVAPAQPVYVAPQPTYVPSRPAPVIYPRNGQSPERQEADHRDCNRWATSQPSAMADTGVFNRAVDACMDGRGYTLR